MTTWLFSCCTEVYVGWRSLIGKGLKGMTLMKRGEMFQVGDDDGVCEERRLMKTQRG